MENHAIAIETKGNINQRIADILSSLQPSDVEEERQMVQDTIESLLEQ